MFEVARSNRYHIAVFGRRNVGKSSLVNSLVGQNISIVSDIAGTTTDTVWKNIELPGIGAAVIADTAGFDDVGALGVKRIDAARKVVARVDLALLLLGDNVSDSKLEMEWYALLKSYSIPVIPVVGKCDKVAFCEAVEGWKALFGEEVFTFSSFTGSGRDALLEKMAMYYRKNELSGDITSSLVEKGDVVVLVMPQDEQAPKGRLIQPQVQVLRNLLDKHCIPLCCAPEELSSLLQLLNVPPSLVITDSQVFGYVEQVVPDGVRITSFSVLMARYKGDIDVFVEGARAMLEMPSDGRVLIAEACSHVPQNEDIGRVKLPRLLRKHFGSELSIDIVSGNDFPTDLSGYNVVVHCGACMFTRGHVIHRICQAKNDGVPITNYGIAIAALLGILDKIVY